MHQTYRTPDEIYGELFVDVQLARIFQDSKTFTDCIPKSDPEAILRAYSVVKSQPSFSLFDFVMQHFTVPGQRATDFSRDWNEDIETHIERLWPVLSRSEDQSVVGSSLIPLPHPYVVPGGRFREIYYWDSYFTQLGLAASGMWKTVEDMVQNFAYLIDHLGHIPNGNRTYFISRSQPPFFAFMVELLAGYSGGQIYLRFLEQLQKEYNFWMDGYSQMNTGQTTHRRVVRLAPDKFLNRYYDDYPKPRQESFVEDVHLAGKTSRNQEDLFLNLRAACESGWDFSSRWCDNPRDLTTIKTTHLIAVDLNCCLLKLERILQKAYALSGDRKKEKEFEYLSSIRKDLIMQYCWDETSGYFFDYNFVKEARSESIHAAGMFPLFLELVSEEKAKRCINFAVKHLWAEGGIATTTLQTGQQWDALNGWAPLQWVNYSGLVNYGFNDEAKDLAYRWMRLNNQVLDNTGKLLEKYNVLDVKSLAGGGEYPVQDGFGWTNGVYLAMLKDLSPSGH